MIANTQTAVVENKIFGGNVTCQVIESNASEEFSNKIRKHGADGSIPQAVGPSKNAAWLGDDKYESERMVAGRANGTFPEEVIGSDKRIVMDTGHDFEEAVLATGAVKLMQERWKEARLKHGGTIMSIRDHIEVIVHPTPREEYRNSAYPDFAAHIDGFIQVVKGRIVLNPAFVIGGPEKNYIILPDSEDHWYIADAKTCQSSFSTNWTERDENGTPVGGMKFGVAPTHYRQQLLGYLGILAPLHRFEGAMLLASKSDHLDEHGHAQVFIPFDEDAQAEAEAILDEVSRKNRDSYNGRIPSVAECKDVARAIAELPLQYPDVNAGKKVLELEPSKWRISVNRLIEIKKEIAKIDEQLSPIKAEIKQLVEDRLGDKIAGSITLNTKTRKELTDEYDKILLLSLEDIQDAPGAFYIDPDTGITASFSAPGGLKMTSATEQAIKDDYPEIYEDLKARFPSRKVKFDSPELRKIRKK